MDRYKNLFSDEDIKLRKQNPLSALFDSDRAKSTDMITSPVVVVSSIYAGHPLLKDKSHSFSLAVQEIDRSIDLNSSSVIVQYGADIQRKIGEMTNSIADICSKLNKNPVMDCVKSISDEMKKTEDENFLGKKKTGFFSSRDFTIQDYVDVFVETQNYTDRAITTIQEQIVAIKDLLKEAEQIIVRHDALLEQLDAHLIAGKFVADRSSKRMFKEQMDLFYEQQFSDRLEALATFINVCMLNFAQTKLIINNITGRVLQAQSFIDLTYQTWKTSIWSKIHLWEAKSLDFSMDFKSIAYSNLTIQPKENT